VFPDPKAALFAGLKRGKMVFLSYVMIGVLASMAGVLLSARPNAAKSDYGTSYSLAGGPDFGAGRNRSGRREGGRPGRLHRCPGVDFLSSGFQIMRFSIHLIDFIWGAFLVLVIILNMVMEKRNGKRHA